MDIQHRSKLTPTKTIQTPQGVKLTLPSDQNEYAALTSAVGQVVSFGSGTGATVGYLIRVSPVSGGMEAEIRFQR